MKTFLPADILLPKNVDMHKWSVVACDQYTSDRAYWEETKRLCGDAPSTLHLIFPEVYLNDGDKQERIRKINETMQDYLDSNLFETVTNSFIYTERTLADGTIRHGLIGVLDLDDYDFTKGSETPIRATEGTVLDRIPPRVAIRREAALELPHIMVLIDDEKRTVIEPLTARKGAFEKLYDFDLMQNGGHVEGRRVNDADARAVLDALDGLADPDLFAEKYGVTGKKPLVFAVGDGNHSLATAKTCKEQFGGSRYAMAEIVNLHDDSLQFDAIHRVVFGMDKQTLFTELLNSFEDILLDADEEQLPKDFKSFDILTDSSFTHVSVRDEKNNLVTGSLQQFLDSYLEKYGGTIDYIHGKKEVAQLVTENKNTVGFYLPTLPKNELFRTVILDGALPRKTFSMGHAHDKRFYLECRKTDKA